VEPLETGLPRADAFESLRRQAEACKGLTTGEVVSAFLELLRLAEAQLSGAPDGERARRWKDPPHPSFFALRDRLIAEQGLRPCL